jgi:hypothetical protein
MLVDLLTLNKNQFNGTRKIQRLCKIKKENRL